MHLSDDNKAKIGKLMEGSQRQMRGELMTKMHEARSRLFISIIGLTEEEMAQSGACGAWSVRDILVHLCAWDVAAAAAYKAVCDGRPAPFLNLSRAAMEKFNQDSVAASGDKSVSDIVSEMRTARAAMNKALEAASIMTFSMRIPDIRSASFTLADCVDVTTRHDIEHAKMIEAYNRTAVKKRATDAVIAQNKKGSAA